MYDHRNVVLKPFLGEKQKQKNVFEVLRREDTAFFSISRGSHLHERKKQKLVSFPSNLENDSGSGSERLGKHIFGAKTTKKRREKPSKFSRFFLANFSVKHFLHSFLPSSSFLAGKVSFGFCVDNSNNYSRKMHLGYFSKCFSFSHAETFFSPLLRNK
jgi:hypothetical protein